MFPYNQPFSASPFDAPTFAPMGMMQTDTNDLITVLEPSSGKILYSEYAMFQKGQILPLVTPAGHHPNWGAKFYTVDLASYLAFYAKTMEYTRVTLEAILAKRQEILSKYAPPDQQALCEVVDRYARANVQDTAKAEDLKALIALRADIELVMKDITVSSVEKITKIIPNLQSDLSSSTHSRTETTVQVTLTAPSGQELTLQGLEFLGSPAGQQSHNWYAQFVKEPQSKSEPLRYTPPQQ